MSAAFIPFVVYFLAYITCVALVEAMLKTAFM